VGEGQKLVEIFCNVQWVAWLALKTNGRSFLIRGRRLVVLFNHAICWCFLLLLLMTRCVTYISIMHIYGDFLCAYNFDLL
jgi:hypothetical protein